jgi:hypothetical protein
VHCKSKKTHHRRLAWTYILLVTFTIFFFSPDYSMDGIVDEPRIVAPEKTKTRINDPLRGKHNGPADLALNRSASGLSFGSSLSLLRFDFKQNLRTWPVLSNGIERSPPAFKAV